MSSVTAGGPGLVAVGRDDSCWDADAAVWVSANGYAWERVAKRTLFGTEGNQAMSSVTAGGPGLVAVGNDLDSDEAAVWVSTDGYAWTRVPHDEAVFGEGMNAGINSVTAGGPGLVAVGSSDSGDEESDDDAAVWVSVPAPVPTPSPAASPAPAGTGQGMTIDDTTVVPGQRVRVKATGFAPGSGVSILFGRDYVALGQARADRNGIVRTVVRIPPSTQPGCELIAVEGVGVVTNDEDTGDMGYTVRVTVVPGAPRAPDTAMTAPVQDPAGFPIALVFLIGVTVVAVLGRLAVRYRER
jgi:hypothetical protein